MLPERRRAAGRRRIRSSCLQMLPEHLFCVHCDSVLRLDDLFVHECPANQRRRGIVTRRWRCRQAAAGLSRFQHPDHGQGPWLRRLGHSHSVSTTDICGCRCRSRLAAVLACATMQTSAQHQRRRYRAAARRPKGLCILAVVRVSTGERPTYQGRRLAGDLLRLVSCFLDPCRHLCFGQARLLVDGVTLCRV